MILVDTDVLIWHLRGLPAAAHQLDQLNELILSAVSHMEILQGIRNKNELAAFNKMLQHRHAIVLPISETISHLAIELLEALSLSHGLQMGDALIASTALTHNLHILTGNTKHFRAVSGLEVVSFAS